MPNNYTISFLGEEKLENFDNIKPHIKKAVRKIIADKKPSGVFVSTETKFEREALNVVLGDKHTVKELSDITLSCFVPYYTKMYLNNMGMYHSFFDNLEFIKESVKAPHSLAVMKCYKEIINRSDLSVFYVRDKKSLPYKAFKYAMRKKKEVINLADTL